MRFCNRVLLFLVLLEEREEWSVFRNPDGDHEVLVRVASEHDAYRRHLRAAWPADSDLHWYAKFFKICCISRTGLLRKHLAEIIYGLYVFQVGSTGCSRTTLKSLVTREIYLICGCRIMYKRSTLRWFGDTIARLTFSVGPCTGGRNHTTAENCGNVWVRSSEGLLSTTEVIGLMSDDWWCRSRRAHYTRVPVCVVIDLPVTFACVIDFPVSCRCAVASGLVLELLCQSLCYFSTFVLSRLP